jgi:hypothetical protein
MKSDNPDMRELPRWVIEYDGNQSVIIGPLLLPNEAEAERWARTDAAEMGMPTYTLRAHLAEAEGGDPEPVADDTPEWVRSTSQAVYTRDDRAVWHRLRRHVTAAGTTYLTTGCGDRVGVDWEGYFTWSPPGRPCASCGDTQTPRTPPIDIWHDKSG